MSWSVLARARRDVNDRGSVFGASDSIDEFRDLSTEVIIDPPQYKSGNLIYPYGEAKK